MKTISFILILLCLISFPNKVYSQRLAPQQPNCFLYEKFKEVLLKDYNENINFRGISEKGNILVEIWVNKESGSFTIIRVGVVNKQKLVCASIGGEAWHEVEIPKKEM